MNIKRNDFLNVPFFKKKCIAITDSYSHYETIFAREEPRFNINKISGWTQPLSIFFCFKVKDFLKIYLCIVLITTPLHYHCPCK